MKIVCIGAGRLAHQLIPALQQSGCEILQVYNRTIESAKKLADQTNATYTSSLGDIIPNADAYFLTVSDDIIPTLAGELKKVINQDSLVVHCSGVLTLDTLPFERAAGFYPLQSFSDNHDVSFRYIPIIITTHDDDIWIMLDQAAGRLTSAVYRMTEDQKSVTHLAAVFANNFTNHMLTLAENICTSHDLPFEILKPLILETFSKAILSGPANSQTGPAARGDKKTIGKHLEILKAHPALVSVYKAITESISTQHK